MCPGTPVIGSFINSPVIALVKVTRNGLIGQEMFIGMYIGGRATART